MLLPMISVNLEDFIWTYKVMLVCFEEIEQESQG
jgi:hypothetical protein